MSSFFPSSGTDDSLEVPTTGGQIPQSYDGLWNFDTMGADASFQQGSHPGSIGLGSQLGGHVSKANICAYQKVRVHTEPECVHHTCL